MSWGMKSATNSLTRIREDKFDSLNKLFYCTPLLDEVWLDKTEWNNNQEGLSYQKEITSERDHSKQQYVPAPTSPSRQDNYEDVQVRL